MELRLTGVTQCGASFCGEVAPLGIPVELIVFFLAWPRWNERQEEGAVAQIV